MKIYSTELKAIDLKDGELKTWCGPDIKAISWTDAEDKIKEFGYLVIKARLIAETGAEIDSPWTNYDLPNLN